MGGSIRCRGNAGVRGLLLMLSFAIVWVVRLGLFSRQITRKLTHRAAGYGAAPAGDDSAMEVVLHCRGLDRATSSRSNWKPSLIENCPLRDGEPSIYVIQGYILKNMFFSMDSSDACGWAGDFNSHSFAIASLYEVGFSHFETWLRPAWVPSHFAISQHVTLPTSKFQ